MAPSKRKEHRKEPHAVRLDHLDAHTAHMAVLATTDEDGHDAMRAYLRKMPEALHAAIDTLLEFSLAHLDPDNRKKVEEYLAQGNLAKAKSWLAGDGYPLLQMLARTHIDSHLKPYGGSFKSFLHHLGKIISAPFRFAKHLIEGGSKTIGHVAENLAPVADIAAKVAPAAAMAV